MEPTKAALKLYDWQEKIRDHKGDVTIRGGRQDGKSWGTAYRIFKLAKEYPGSRHLIIAAAERQGSWLFDKVKELIKKDYEGRKTNHYLKVKSTKSEIFKFAVGKTGIYLEGLSSIDFIHADEAIHVGRKVWDSVLPMMAEPKSRGLGWLTLLSSTRGKPKGYFFDSFKNPKFLQIQIKSEDCPHISKEFLEDEKKRLGERMYKVIYDGEFDEDANKYFPKEKILEAVKIKSFSKKDIDKNKHYSLGIDPAKYGKSKAAFAESEISDDKAKIVYGEEMQKSSFIEMREKTKELQLLFNNQKIFYDNGGLGQGFDEFFEKEKTIKRKLRALNNAQAGKYGKILKEDLYSNVLNLLFSNKLEIVDQKEIIDGLLNVEVEGAEGEEKIIGTDMSEAIVRSLWGFKEKYLKAKILSF